jgi:manganese/zinc/iron transport system substrate-binding protein
MMSRFWLQVGRSGVQVFRCSGAAHVSRLALLLAAMLAVAALSGCSSGAQGDVAGRKIKATCTIGMVADTVRNVGGERVEVTALMGPGVDPHLYKASEGDMGKLAGADVIFYNGLNLEGKMADILVKMASGSRRVVAVTEGVDPSLLREPPEFQGHYDPHIWFDVSMWTHTVDPVVRTLSEMDPGSKALYEENGKRYREQLTELHAYCKQQLSTVPSSQRVLITAHDAFGYFGRAYEVRVVGLQGISTVSAVSLRDVERLVDEITRSRIKAVFVESSVPRKSIEAVVAGCKRNGHDVKIGGTLFSDAMGAAGTPEGKYPGMVRHNVDTIVAALK